MKNLVLSSALLIFLFSCASYTDKFQSSSQKTENYTPEYLLNAPNELTFRMFIEAYGNHFGGILVGKKLNPNQYRFAFLNEFGGKFLDFELHNQELKVNYAISDLNKKIILNLLKTDFNLIFSEENQISNTYKYEDYTVLESEINQKPVYYFLENEVLNKTTLTGKTKEKINVNFQYVKPSFPEVEIIHKKGVIKISLHLLEK